MYEELVKSLRTDHDKYFARDMEAADAIEELSRRIERAVDLYNRNVEKTAMYEALIGLSPEPSKEDE